MPHGTLEGGSATRESSLLPTGSHDEQPFQCPSFVIRALFEEPRVVPAVSKRYRAVLLKGPPFNLSPWHSSPPPKPPIPKAPCPPARPTQTPPPVDASYFGSASSAFSSRPSLQAPSLPSRPARRCRRRRYHHQVIGTATGSGSGDDSQAGAPTYPHTASSQATATTTTAAAATTRWALED